MLKKIDIHYILSWDNEDQKVTQSGTMEDKIAALPSRECEVN